MYFPYLKLPIRAKSHFFTGTILKPIIPIKLSVGTNSVRYAALVDSGADFCVFDASIGEYLGITVKKGQEEQFGGIQEKNGAVAYLHEITMKIGTWDYKTVVAFSYDIVDYGFGILGQKGFFDNFIVKFTYAVGSIEIKEHK